MTSKAGLGQSALLCCCALVTLSVFPLNVDEGLRTLNVMTRNMDAGTDLNLIFYYYPDIPAGVSATLAEVIASDIPHRAELLAEEIVTRKPDFIGLQEVTIWGMGTCGATTVLYDQLELLLHGLEKRNVHYRTVALNHLTTLEAPANATT